MRIARLLPALAWLALGSVPAPAGDLTKIDRTIHKEPTYQVQPKYCLLVFGPKAMTRVWLVQDGNILYIDRNGNGDTTEIREWIAWKGANHLAAGDIPGPDGKPGYTLSLRKYGSSMRLFFHQDGKQRYIVGDPDADALVFADRPSEAPVAHIGGPLSIELSHYGLGAGSLALRVRVGTAGLGKGAFAARVLPDIAPVAEIEFPSKKRGAAPIMTKATLKNR